jgi:hypothetical protein
MAQMEVACGSNSLYGIGGSFIDGVTLHPYGNGTTRGISQLDTSKPSCRPKKLPHIELIF